MNRTLYGSLLILALMGAPQWALAGDPAPSLTKNITSKSKDKKEIEALQVILIDLGYTSVSKSGKFDNATKAALTDFRKKHDLKDNSGGYNPSTPEKVREKLISEWQIASESKAESQKLEILANSTPTPTPSPSATPIQAVVDSPVVKKVTFLTPDDLSEHGLKLEFVGYNLETSGSLPEECAKRLKYGDRKEFGSETSDSADSISSANELALRSKRIGVQIVFHGDENEKSLADCVEKHKDDKKKSVKLKKYVDHSGKAMIAGLLNESDEFSPVDPRVVSPTFKKIELAIGNCPECDKDPALTRELIDEVNGLDYSFLVGTQKELIRKSLAHIEEDIRNAKSLSELKRLRAELQDLSKQVDRLSIDASEKESILSAISADYDLLLKANEGIANESRKACSQKSVGRSFYKGSTCGAESQHADFIASTHEAIAKLPGLDDASRDNEMQIASEYAAGGLSRVEFISSLDPAHEEVVDALNNGHEDLQYLGLNVQRSCAWLTPATFASCNQAKYEYQQTLQTYQSLSQRYSGLQSQSLSQMGPGIMQQNGFAPNGFAPNGFAPNGFAPNGFAPNGFAPNGFAPNGFAPNGFAPNGFAPNSAPQGNGFQYAMFPQSGPSQQQPNFMAQQNSFQSPAFNQTPSQMNNGFAQSGNFQGNGQGLPTAVPLSGNFNSWNQPGMF
jgi:hypothetical protein